MNASGGMVTGLAGRYANALFDLAREQKSIDSVSASLSGLRAALGESEDLRALIGSPVLARDAARKAIAAVAQSMKLDSITSKFLGVLAVNRRLVALPQIIRGFEALAARHRGEVTAEVTSAQPLSEAQVAALKTKLKSGLGQDVNIDLSVDPAILGGLVVKVGSRMIDSSIATKLNSLAHAMKG